MWRLLRLSPQPRQDPLVFGPRSRGQPEPAESGLVLEVDLQPVGEIGPAHDPARGAGRALHALVGWAEGDEDFAAIGAPAGDALVLEPLVGGAHPPEVLVERLVLRRAAVGIGGL